MHSILYAVHGFFFIRLTKVPLSDGYLCTLQKNIIHIYRIKIVLISVWTFIQTTPLIIINKQMVKSKLKF